MLVPAVVAVVAVIETTATATTTIITIIVIKDKRSLSHLIHNTSSIVGPMVSIQFMTVVEASTSFQATKILPFIQIKWVDDKQMYRVGVDLLFHESLGGLRVK
mmetsp:Transcript_13242/g.14191  ORF Transcript_13242/g.14191 Transcript_13242/m.14191 type:complete len:103 (-) Transcript_13242:42-350(-)